MRLPARQRQWLISIHAPREGSDSGRRGRIYHHLDFNPRSPRGERLRFLRPFPSQSPISIHAPREGSDVLDALTAQRLEAFQSTLPARGATVRTADVYWVEPFQSTLPARGATPVRPTAFLSVHISIHAPREGSDGGACGRHVHDGRFQSTLPARGATLCPCLAVWAA